MSRFTHVTPAFMLPSRSRSAALLSALLLSSVLTDHAGASIFRSGAARSRAAVVPNHIVRPSLQDDGDGDKISDRLAQAIAKQDFVTLPNAVIRAHSARAEAKGLSNASSTIVNAIACFDHAPTDADVAALKARGFDVKDVYSHAIYAVHIIGEVPGGVQTLRDLVKAVPGITLIQPDNVMKINGLTGTRQIGARQSWTRFEPHNVSYALQGDPERAIAIMDTGIDDTHPDLIGDGHKLAAFVDEYAGNSTPTDYVGHGTFVAGVAAGTGVSGGLASGTGYLPLTIVGNAFNAYFDFLIGDIPVDTSGYTASVPLTVNAYDPDFYADQTDTFAISTAADLTSTVGLITTPTTALTGSSTPTTLTATIAPDTVLDLYPYFASTDPNDYNTVAFAVQTPQTAIGDGFNLVAGTAPASQIVSLRVGDTVGDIDEDAVLRGYDYVSKNASRYNIGVLNMSYGLDGETDTAQDTAVDALVAQGIVCVAAAGNSRYDETAGNLPAAIIGSPASATNAIAVAAVGNANQITDYSSYGGTVTVSTTTGTTTTTTMYTQEKPDVSAPGGSYPSADLAEGVTDVPAHDESITSVDSNYSDNGQYNDITDVQANDYTDDVGTSFSSPHVAGSAALLEQALTLPGAFGEQALSGGDEAFTIKALLEMTSTSTEANTADATPQPAPATPGARDLSEGYGKINTDAALGAVLNTILPGGAPVYESLGTTATTVQANAIAPQAYAANVSLTAGISYTFSLVPTVGTGSDAGADYDLFLYSSGYATEPTADLSVSSGASGDPILLASSATAGSTAQTITYSPKSTDNEVDVLVVKRVSGSGLFELTSTGYSPDNLTVQVNDATTTTPIADAEVVASNSVTGQFYDQGPTVTTPATMTTAAVTNQIIPVPANASLTLTATAFGYYENSIASAAGAATATIPLTPSHSFTTTGLQMISVPMQYTGQTIAAITLPQLDTAAVWSPTADAYAVTPSSPANTFQVGQGYWVRLRQPTSINLQGTAVTAPTYTIPLQLGWNMIGSPYATPNSLSDATVTLSNGTSDTFASAETTGVVSNLYSYDPAANAYDQLGPTDTPTAYLGYWIHADQNCSLTVSGS